MGCEKSSKCTQFLEIRANYALSIHRKKLPVVYDFTTKGKIFNYVQKHQYLAMTIATDFNWKYHDESIVHKANRSLSFI